MVRVQNKHWSPNTHKPPADSKIYRPRSPPLAWSSTPVSTKSSCTRHLHLQPEGSGMVETTWSPSHAMEWRPQKRLKTAGDNIDGGFQHRPRPFPLEVNHCCPCRLYALVARDLVSEWMQRANEHDDKSLFVSSVGLLHIHTDRHISGNVNVECNLLVHFCDCACRTSFIEGPLPYPSNTILALQYRRLT